ncbi:MAG: hypothetical protein COV46_02690 [Deltaproteobacteria bacterium CG11_big_fil_rev_8_21_14_0_20_49_13]|nr:MAG: hypothetical protein COV46_02690 [Deltaproteobacteria bacterium CG11_big_fil_rev_8_21_14_0_20_49_13]
MLQIWKLNTIPLPYPLQVAGPSADLPSEHADATADPAAHQIPVEMDPVVLPPMVEVDDLFPKGRIVRFFPHQGYGFITDRNGKQVYFNLNEIDFVGSKSKDDIKIGIPIGYDVSHTSHGLHVKKIKIY